VAYNIACTRCLVIGGLLAAGVLAFVLAAGAGHQTLGILYPYRWHLAVCIFGMAVGASEMVGRYRDAPFRTLSTGAALSYIAINAIAALCAYVLIRRFNLTFNLAATDPNLELVRAMVAGFGSMAFFRSSLFNVKVGDTEVPVGPGIFFQVLLFATDRACDRQRAIKRTALVTEIMNGVSYNAAHVALPEFCFQLMQNLPATEADRIRQVIKAVAEKDRIKDGVTDADKVFSIGLILMNAVGSPALKAAVRGIGPRLQEPAKIEYSVFTKLEGVDFDKAFPVLVDVCRVMSRLGTEADQLKAKNDVIAEIGPAQNNPDLDNETKVLMLALALQQRFGDGVLEAALTQLGKSIKAAPATPPADQPPAAGQGNPPPDVPGGGQPPAASGGVAQP
jgi:hypothetical protein